MKNKELNASMLLLLAAAIWGFAFVAQRVGMRYVGAFTFNGVRFALGSISLIPLLIYFKKRSRAKTDPDEIKVGNTDVTVASTFASGENKTVELKLFDILKSGVLVGCVLFSAASLQQIGLAETTAGKAAFITGFYIVLVPFFGIFLKHSIHRSTWIAAGFALIGLYLLSVTKDFTISKGDLFELAGAFMWAIHILLIDKYSQKIDPIKLSFIQFLTCSILSLGVAFGFENITLIGLSQALIPILYGGIASVGIAYTLQVVGQKNAKPSHAAIILSMESVFASIGGILMLGEVMGVKGYMGCALMLTGMLLSQMGSFKKIDI